MPTGVYKRKMPKWTPQVRRLNARIWARVNHHKQRAEVLLLLGGKCKRCGFSEFDALEIDHIKPQRRKRGDIHSGTKIVKDIKKGRISIKKLQILCSNCHTLKTKREDKIRFKNLIKRDLKRGVPKTWRKLYE